MSVWIRFFAVTEGGRRTYLGGPFNSEHEAYTHANPEEKEHEVLVDLERLPKGTKQVMIQFVR